MKVCSAQTRKERLKVDEKSSQAAAVGISIVRTVGYHVVG